MTVLLRDRSTRRARPTLRRAPPVDALSATRGTGGSGDSTYVLVRDEVTVAGWRLLALHGRGDDWSLSLATRGAAPTAPARVAKAVALRVLQERGVDVAAWHGAGGDLAPMFRAEVLRVPSSAA